MPYAKRKTMRKSTRKAPVRVTRVRTSAPRRKTAYKSRTKSTLGSLGGRVQLRDRPQRQIGAQPFARSMFVRLAYSDSFSQSAPATTNLYGVTTWSLNSLFDPDVTGTGHQPMQYDQLTGIYRKYQVYGAKVQLEFSNPSTDGLFVGYALRARALVGINALTVGEATEHRNTVQTPMQNTGTQLKRFSFYVKIHELCGVPKLLYNAGEAQFAAAYNANPTEFAYLEVGTCSTTGSAISVNVRIRITYFAKMYNYLTQSQS